MDVTRFGTAGIFQKIGCGLVFSLITPFILSGTQQLYSQEKKTATTELQTGKQVVEQVNVIEGGEMLGRIDWENMVIYSVGDGVMPPDSISPAQARVRAKRAATDEAYGRIVEMANEVRVDAESTTRNYINENRVIQTKVTGMVKNAEITEVKQFDDGSYQLMMRMPMIGANGLGQALLPVEMEMVRKVKVVSTTKRNDIISKSEISPLPTNPDGNMQKVEKAENYTGLIVVAQGLDAKPAMYPRVIKESGNAVYDVTNANPNAAVENGLVAYRKSLVAAEQVARIGNNPLTIKAQKVSGKYNADLVISDEDAQKIQDADSKSGILGEAKVVVVID